MAAINKRGFVVAVLLSVFFASVFAICGGFYSGFSTQNLTFFSVSGAIIGMIGAPELEPKAFRCSTLWQMLFAVSGCILLAANLHASAESYALAVVGGAILGYLGPYWIKHIQAP